ncbi:hypothetical protein ABRZ58_19650 [Vibrio vulnificus]|uniref:hypothetical protein n=1 Tax=Vibrio vulnificus TaxID=672 RepID=UPI0028C14FDD|nr:hypothetical protein [Vibrio vulnificus]
MKQWARLITIGACLGSASAGAQAELDESKYGYSYFTLGFENVVYEELFPGLDSDASVVSPVLNTGGLYHINTRFDFSIDALATFSPMSATEEWHKNGTLIQTNQFEYLKAATNILLHYKLQDNWRVLGGTSLSYQTYKRYGLKNHNGYVNDVFREGNTWEEKSTDIFLDAGVAYDSGHLYGESDWRVSGRWIFGVPIWSVTENSRFEDIQFNDFGFRTNAEATLSYQIMPGLHLGWFVMLGYEKRFESDPQRVMYTTASGVEKQGQAWLPEAQTWTLNTGLQALWNF